MSTPEQIRIMNDRMRPRTMELWWAMRPLRSVIRFMNSGAHPDDETTSMLATLAIRDGFNLSFACSTRGEGGQNDIGTEKGSDLGALRTAEMEQACDVLGMKLYWLSETARDSITDFGFSKSGKETLGKWGAPRTLARFVEIVRTERPDILCPTFLDVPGQHGHHRAMTQTAHLVMAAAADKRFPSNLEPWQVSKLYLPAWSGAGRSYDDLEDPPDTTLAIDGSGRDPASGWNWHRIAQQSRCFHRSQGMGRWMATHDDTDWPLHLAECHVPGPDTSLASGIPASLADLTMIDGSGPIVDSLLAAQNHINMSISAWPDYDRVARFAARAHDRIRAALSDCPPDLRRQVIHRLRAKEMQLGHVRRLALGIDAVEQFGNIWLNTGGSTAVDINLVMGEADHASAMIEPAEGCSCRSGQLEVGEDAPPQDSYRDQYDPARPPRPRMRVTFDSHGTGGTCILPLHAPPVILPRYSVDRMTETAILNTTSGDGNYRLNLDYARQQPEIAKPGIRVPEGWIATRAPGGFAITPPVGVAEGLYPVSLMMDGRVVSLVRRISYPHIKPVINCRPAIMQVRVLSAKIPDVRIGYAGSGHDRVGHMLTSLGADVTELSDANLGTMADLKMFDTIVLGIFSIRMRPAVAAAMPLLHDWLRAGGTLVTLYHRPWDNWDPDVTPPARLEIGQPSLRWRVTDEAAQVQHLEPDHPILNHPNLIRSSDWTGWKKERGLYFASSWDSSYLPLLAMADPGEDNLTGSLLVADIGHGRHVHTSLSLHHQLEMLVPGACRLMANMIASRT